MLEKDLSWYKDAIIYQVHVRSFCDSTADGIGDFRGLTSKLGYIHDLGATAIWVQPFFPSPLRDNGYDIADYETINPTYGTLADFKAFLRAAHARGLRVIIELVLNHTSERHAWFQRARRAKPGSRHRDFYVWSDSPTLYGDARIIFRDFETSNWTWDPVAGAYYWHRFYSRQPDLNYDSPDVRRAVFQILDHWLAMGVDGLRLDAVPYLFEREGTNCENLPETHAFLQEIRAYVDQHYPGTMLLAEANQWPEDAVAYFGAGDECQCAFHFPVMPRMFMAVQMEDRFPIINIMQQTPEIPETCQWMMFLRNHDELTLEMVTDEERDYMYSVYAHNPQARINLGIRRRLAPLLGGHRKKIELLNSLLLSLPGTPVIYYGDEIGMGDNIYLGDRNGVRTPMQWSSDRNAGFSSANPQQLFLPTIIDHEYHYEAVNVETSLRNGHSLFWWMKRLIALRQQHPVFARGVLRFLTPENNRVLAYLRQDAQQTALVVANLSRFSQFVELDLSEFRGYSPVEMFGHSVFPPVGEPPYMLTLGPHSFYWFLLQPAGRTLQPIVDGPSPAIEESARLPSIKVEGSWHLALDGKARRALTELLPDWLCERRWFAGKGKPVSGVEIADVVPLADRALGADVQLLLLTVNYASAQSENYLLPVSFATERHADQLHADESTKRLAFLEVERSKGAINGVLYDAFGDESFSQLLLELVRGRRRAQGREGRLSGQPFRALRTLCESPDKRLPSRSLRVEQSNSAVVFGDRLLMKLFRKLDGGVNPELELGRFLTETAAFAHSPPIAGALEYRGEAGDVATVAILQGFVRNEADAWTHALDNVHRFFDRVMTTRRDCLPVSNEFPARDLVASCDEPTSQLALEFCNAYLDSAALLGQRTAEMHLALSGAAGNPQFDPEPFTEHYQRSLYQAMRGTARKSLQLLRSRLRDLPEDMVADAKLLLSSEEPLLGRFRAIVGRKFGGARIRCHGDYHLGQVLFTGKDFAIIDFEGEPTRRVSERQIKRSPLRDVAGMLRSFDYASQSVLFNHFFGVAQQDDVPNLQCWAAFWTNWVSSRFLSAYLRTAAGALFLPTNREELRTLLEVFLLEKSTCELAYELSYRPTWVKIPIAGMLRILGVEK